MLEGNRHSPPPPPPWRLGPGAPGVLPTLPPRAPCRRDPQRGPRGNSRPLPMGPPVAVTEGGVSTRDRTPSPPEVLHTRGEFQRTVWLSFRTQGDTSQSPLGRRHARGGGARGKARVTLFGPVRLSPRPHQTSRLLKVLGYPSRGWSKMKKSDRR